MKLSASPTQTCELCYRSVVVVPDGRGFPPDIAARKLKKECNACDCESKPKYTAGYNFNVSRLNNMSNH
jgi:hypothetical protein